MARRYFLACFILTVCIVAGQPRKYELKGTKFNLKPDIAGQPDGILWKHNGNKVVEFNGKEEQVYSSYENRVTLGWVSAELNITDIRFEDSGHYELEIDLNKGLHRFSYDVEVIDKVAKPTISCEMNSSSSSASSAVLVCSSEPGRRQSLTKVEWKTHGNVKPGQKLTISLGDGHNDEVYICNASNPVSSETATFTAKDCYSGKSSSAALIATLVSIFGVIVVVVGILFCKLRHKACFAKRDLEKQSPPGTTEGPDKRKSQDDVKRPLLDRVTTLPSTRPLRQFAQEEESLKDRNSAHDMEIQDEMPLKGHVKAAKMKLFGENNRGQTQTENHTEEQKGTASPPSPPPSESPSPPDQNNPASNDDGDVDADRHSEPAEEEVPQYDPPDSERSNEPEPDGVSDGLSEDVQSDLEVSIAPEQPEPEKETEEDEKSPTSENSPAAQPHSPMSKSSPNMAPEEQEEDAGVTGGAAEKNERESDSSGEGERNESDDSNEDKQLSIIPEQGSSGTILHDMSSQEETHTNKDNQQETVKPVSEDEDETDKEEDLYSAASQEPQSPTTTKPDNENSKTFQESPDAAHADPDQEEKDKEEEEEEHKPSRDSDESEGQSEKSEDETDEGLRAT